MQRKGKHDRGKIRQHVMGEKFDEVEVRRRMRVIERNGMKERGRGDEEGDERRETMSILLRHREERSYEENRRSLSRRV